MLAKILMCLYFEENFHSNEENKFVKKLIHFHCKCDDEREYFVLTCKSHPFLHPCLPKMYRECSYKYIELFEICNFCVQVKYLIHFRC